MGSLPAETVDDLLGNLLHPGKGVLYGLLVEQVLEKGLVAADELLELQVPGADDADQVGKHLDAKASEALYRDELCVDEAPIRGVEERLDSFAVAVADQLVRRENPRRHPS